jgi:hypothetical protein
MEEKKESRDLEVVEIEQCGNREITTIGRDLLASSKVVVENRSRLPGAVVEDGATRTSMVVSCDCRRCRKVEDRVAKYYGRGSFDQEGDRLATFCFAL